MDKISNLPPAQKNLVLSSGNSNDYIFIKKAKSIRRVNIDDIIYISVEERYCTIVTNTDKFVIQISLTQISAFFEEHNFIRTHRNSIINPSKIIEIIPNENIILLQENHSVVLSDGYKDFLTKQIIF